MATTGSIIRRVILRALSGIIRARLVPIKEPAIEPAADMTATFSSTFPLLAYFQEDSAVPKLMANLFVPSAAFVVSPDVYKRQLLCCPFLPLCA